MKFCGNIKKVVIFWRFKIKILLLYYNKKQQERKAPPGDETERSKPGGAFSPLRK